MECFPFGRAVPNAPFFLGELVRKAKACARGSLRAPVRARVLPRLSTELNIRRASLLLPQQLPGPPRPHPPLVPGGLWELAGAPAAEWGSHGRTGLTSCQGVACRGFLGRKMPCVTQTK